MPQDASSPDLPRSTRLFLDCEFTGLHQFTTLISLGISSEPGEEFYAEFTDYDRRQDNDWLREHVFAHTRWLRHGERGPLALQEGALTLCLGDGGFVREQLAAWLNRFPRIEMWADCPAWDWVLFCQLFGGASQIPRHIFYLPLDLATLFVGRGLSPDTSRLHYSGLAPTGDTGQPHNALWDARVAKACHAQLTRLS